jgi:pantoate--beta-alanine ligase
VLTRDASAARTIRIVRTRAELRDALAKAPRPIGLVPTMGWLHAGHRALIERARGENATTVVSIFVNPKQFGDPADLERYPRNEARDMQISAESGADLVFAPAVDEIYPPGFDTSVRVGAVAEPLEGAARPGHFDGVATVVAKLLLSVRPDVALFGEKDFQQLAVIRRMVQDLNVPVEIVPVPTVREADGLALSSRNAYLRPGPREQAVALPRALQAARAAILGGRPVAEVLQEAKASLRAAGFSRVDYFALVDAGTLEPLEEPEGAMRLIAAAVIGTTRLIDNLMVESR